MGAMTIVAKTFSITPVDTDDSITILILSVALYIVVLSAVVLNAVMPTVLMLSLVMPNNAVSL